MALQERLHRPPSNGALQDIYDGDGCQVHKHLISLLLNTDGVAIYRSSKISIWPVWAVVNELPPSLRLTYYGMCHTVSVGAPGLNFFDSTCCCWPSSILRRNRS